MDQITAIESYRVEISKPHLMPRGEARHVLQHIDLADPQSSRRSDRNLGRMGSEPGNHGTMKLRHTAALALAGYFAGCGISTQMANGQLDQIKVGMTREEVVAKLGEPPMGATVKGILTNDDYDCDVHGQIMVISEGPEFTFLPFAMLVDKKELNNLSELSRECTVNYDTQGRVVSTSEGNVPALLFAK